MSAESEYYAGILSGLAGYLVKGAGVDGKDFCLVLEHPVTRKEVLVWVMQDGEGNGPGAVEVDRQ